MLKKSVACCIALMLLIGALGLAAAEGDWQFDADSGTLTAYTGPGGEITVPSQMDGKDVLKLGDGLFYLREDITALTLPDGLERIGVNALYGCSQLNGLQLPQGLQVIDDYALFMCTALEQLELPAALVYLGNNSLAFCSALSDIRFLGELPFIGADALQAGAEEPLLTVPGDRLAAYEAALGMRCQPGADAQAVDYRTPEAELVFDAQSGMIQGYVGTAALAQFPSSVGGVAVQGIAPKALFGNRSLLLLHLPEGLERIGEEALAYAQLRVVTLPEGLEEIGRAAFKGSRVQSMKLPGSLRTMGSEAFAFNQLTEITVPEGVTALPEAAFKQNTLLEDVSLPASLQEIGSEAFAGCSALDYLVLGGKGVPTLGQDAFLQCPIADVDIAWDASKDQAAAARAALVAGGLAADSFELWRSNPPDEPPYPRASTFTFDADTGTVSNYQGQDEAMTMYWNFIDAQTGNKVMIRALGDGLFEGSALKRFSVPHSDALTHIGDRAFKDSQLQQIHLFDSVTHIGQQAFANCKNLQEITLPASVEAIGAGAFEGCAALERVVFLGGTPQIERGAFQGCEQLAEVVLPAQAHVMGALEAPPRALRVAAEATQEQVDALAKALELPWHSPLLRAGEPDPYVPMPAQEVANAEADFEFDAATGTVTKYVGKAAQVVVPASIGGVPVTGVGFLAFSDATVATFLQDSAANTGLTRVVLPPSVTEIGDSAFLECRALKELVCYGQVERIGIRAFENCVALETAHFPNGVRQVDGYAFHLAENLHDLDLGRGTEEIAEGAFQGTGLSGHLTLHSPVIGNVAFKDAGAVISIHVTATVKQIGAGAFHGMPQLKAIYFDHADADLLGLGNFQFSEDMQGFKLCLPLDASDEQVAQFVSVLNQNLLPGKDMVIREAAPAR